MITGANRSIGLELTRQFADDDWKVLACTRNPAAATEQSSLKDTFPTLHIFELDVTKRSPIVKYIPYLLFLIPVYVQAASPAKLISPGPNPDAPEQIMEYGQLVGTWQCKSFGLQQDGTWKEAEGVNTWTWHYVLNGLAIQDVWQPQPNAEGKVLPGTNLRTYDADTGIWNVVWTLSSSARIESFISSYRNDAIHITTEREATARFPAHMMHITFHNISEKHFDWKYESSALTDGQNWRELSRLSCDRDTELANASK